MSHFIIAESSDLTACALLNNSPVVIQLTPIFSTQNIFLIKKKTKTHFMDFSIPYKFFFVSLKLDENWGSY